MRTRAIPYPQALRWLGIFAWVLLLQGGLTACQPENVETPVSAPPPGITLPTPVSTPTPVAPAPTDAAPPLPDLILTEAQHQQAISIQIGKVINVRGFSGSWMVSYAPEILELITAPERVNDPGPEGWFFRTIAPGETVILLESVPPPCPSEPCMPNIQRFEFPIQVVP